VRVLQSESSHNEDLVDKLSKHVLDLRADLLVLSSNERKGLPYWLLGSVSETASLTAKVPVLVLKAPSRERKFSRFVNFVVGVDVAAPPSRQDVNWIANLARVCGARVHLFYVRPRKNKLRDKVRAKVDRQQTHQVLQGLEARFNEKGISTSVVIKPERKSIPHTITEYAAKTGAWLTITTTAQRSRAQKLLLGSNARHILMFSKGPFLSLRRAGPRFHP
jgi:nucleotide-binding universal stress UspA family protein